jgi:tetratricopeptide (TPR) repeat protein
VLSALIAAAVLMPALPAATAAEVSGPYLAARTAIRSADYREAAAYYTRALAREPSNPLLLDGALAAQIGQGAIPAAIPIAERIAALGGRSLASVAVRIADLSARGQYDALLADLAAGGGIGPLPDTLIAGWARAGAGRMAEALADFDRAAAMPGLRPFGLYHKALALALAGDFEGADAALAADAGGFRTTRRGAVAHAQILSQLDRFADAAAALDAVFGTDRDAEADALRAALAAGAPVPFTIVTTPRDGLAETFYSLAAALQGEAGDDQTLIYARIAQFLRPDHAEAHLLTGSLLHAMRQYPLAIESYRLIPASSPAALAAELGRVQALTAAGRPDEATAVLRALVAANPELPAVHIALGDALRRQQAYVEAAEAYSRAIALIGAPEPRHWSLFYSRAIAWERAKEWDRAEPDFRQALALNPDQPDVLNYLGYSFLELGRNIDEAMDLIERAVALAPDSGHIVDSLAWGLFLLGRYEEAVEPMERAALLMPVDPIVTDHLGDVYWAVGRRIEAQFQWRRALSFEPEDELADRIRRKLDKGLDAVLAAEGAPPLSARGQ